MRDEFCTDIAPGPRLVLNHDRLAERLSDLRHDEPRQAVGATSGRERHNEVDRTVRVPRGLCALARAARHGGERRHEAGSEREQRSRQAHQCAFRCRAAAHQRHRPDRHDRLSAFVHELVEGLHQAAIGLRAGPPRLGHGNAQRELVARANRSEPAQFVDAWRGKSGLPRQELIDEQSHHHAGGVPPAGNHATERARRVALRVDVERLRVKLAAESDDVGFVDRDRPDLHGQARRVVLEVARVEVTREFVLSHGMPRTTGKNGHRGDRASPRRARCPMSKRNLPQAALPPRRADRGGQRAIAGNCHRRTVAQMISK